MISEAFSPLTAVPSLDEQQVGGNWSVALLNPVTGDFQDVAVRVARSQNLRIDGESVKAFRLDFQAPVGEWVCWVTGDGQVLVQGTPFGLTLRREDLPPEALRALTDAPDAPADRPR